MVPNGTVLEKLSVSMAFYLGVRLSFKFGFYLPSATQIFNSDGPHVHTNRPSANNYSYLFVSSRCELPASSVACCLRHAHTVVNIASGTESLQSEYFWRTWRPRRRHPMGRA